MNFEKLSNYLDTLKDADVKHFVCCVAKDHQTLFTKAVGYSDYEEKIPADFDRMYLLYSSTKVLTCTAAMRLVSEGKLAIDDPVSKYLPAYKNLTVMTEDGIVPAKTTMTLRHLFTMTGGYGARTLPQVCKVMDAFLEKEPNAGTVQIANALAKVPLEFEPGSRYLYGLCHDILAAVVEVAAGERFGSYLKRIIFDPLEMTDFGFDLSDANSGRLCAMYTYQTPLNRSTPTEMPPSHYGFTPNYEAGGAGLFGSPMQYLKFADAMACGGTAANGYTVLPKEYVLMMRENLLEETPLANLRRTPRLFGYGWGLCGRVHMAPSISLAKSPKGEFGWDSAAGAYVLMDTDNHLSLFCSMHTLHCSYAYEKIHPHVRDLVYECLKA